MSKLVYERMAELSKRNAEELNLKAKTVELSAIDDVISANSRLQEVRKDTANAKLAYEKALKEYESERKEAMSSGKHLAVIIKSGNKALAKLEKDAKSLGVDPSTIKMYKTLKMNISSATEEMKASSKL